MHARTLIAVCAGAICAFGASSEAERLVSTGKLWYAAKRFHPKLAQADIDWNAALIRAIPGIRAAKSDEEFAQAVQSMLDVLQDRRQSCRKAIRSPMRTGPDLFSISPNKVVS